MNLYETLDLQKEQIADLETRLAAAEAQRDNGSWLLYVELRTRLDAEDERDTAQARIAALEERAKDKVTIYLHSGDPISCDNADGDTTHIAGINCGSCGHRKLTRHLCSKCASAEQALARREGEKDE